MAKDFRATQIETTKLILSGGIGSKGIGGLIYSGSSATNRSGGIPASMIANVGSDVDLFVSGNVGGKDTSGVTLFGGDLVISGTLHAESQAFVRTVVGSALDVTTNNVIINEGGSAFIDFRVETDAKTNAIFVDASNDSVSILGGGGVYPGTDVGFFVSGAIGDKGTPNAKSISSFGGDLVVSGSTHTGGAVHRKMLFKSSDFIVSSDDHYIFIDTASGHITASLQTAAAAGVGRELIFKDVGGFADANFIVIKPPIGSKIESIADELKIKVASGSVSLISDGVSNYYAFSERD